MKTYFRGVRYPDRLPMGIGVFRCCSTRESI
jgi:hypothetical protein